MLKSKERGNTVLKVTVYEISTMVGEGLSAPNLLN